MNKPPLNVRIIATVFLVLGTLAVADVVAALVLKQSPSIDIGVVFVPIGVGLLRGSNLARAVAEFFIGLGCIGVAVAFALSVWLEFHPDVSVESFLGVVGFGIVLIVLALAWKTFGAVETVEWFRSHPGRGQSQNPWRFSLTTMLVLMLLAAVFFARFGAMDMSFHPRSLVSQAIRSPESHVLVHYGIREHRRDLRRSKVDFVVLEVQLASGDLHSAVTGRMSSDNQNDSATLTTPDGKVIQLPNDQQLFEIRNGVFRASAGKIGKTQLDAFLKNTPADPTIDDLLAMPTAERAAK